MAPRKTDQPQLTKEEIVTAAMKLIDERGVEGCSMRQLGAALGRDPSSLYHYVPSKGALYDLIVDEVVGAVDLSGDDRSAGFEERVVVACTAYLDALLRHPRLVPLVAVRSLRSPVQLRFVESLARIPLDAGFSPGEAQAAVDICGQALLGMANVRAAGLARSEYRGHEEDHAAASLRELSPEQFPNIARMLAESTHMTLDHQFELAMRVLARGLLAMHEAGDLAR